MTHSRASHYLLLLLALMLTGCVGTPEGVQPVSGFQLPRYLGTWYEIARLDHSFERGLEQVTAEYRLRDDGAVQVINRGYDPQSGAWEEAIGKAYFVQTPDLGHLKVSFFGPFYGSYVIFGLDREHYQYAFVAGPNTSYLWLLARTPTVAPEVFDQFVQQAAALGFDTANIIRVRQATHADD